MMGKLRAGLIGLGMMGRHHARVLASLDGVELVAVADPQGDRHRAAGGRPVQGTVEALLAVGIDYCVVAVPTVHHEGVALALAAAGIPTLIEKPLAADLASAQQTVEAFASNGVLGAVGHIERYNAALQQARARITQGVIGRVIQIATRRQGPFPDRIADVGVVKDLAIHDIDLTSWVAQSPYSRVWAQTAFLSGRQHEDLVVVSGRLEDGTITNHLVNWVSPLKERSTVITGERGTFVIDTLTADLTFFANAKVQTTWDDLARFRGVSEGDVTRFAFSKPEPLRVEHEAFRDAVRGQGSDIVTLEQGLHNVMVAEAVLRSAQGGDGVSVLAVGDEASSA